MEDIYWHGKADNSRFVNSSYDGSFVARNLAGSLLYTSARKRVHTEHPSRIACGILINYLTYLGHNLEDA